MVIRPHSAAGVIPSFSQLGALFSLINLAQPREAGVIAITMDEKQGPREVTRLADITQLKLDHTSSPHSTGLGLLKHHIVFLSGLKRCQTSRRS